MPMVMPDSMMDFNPAMHHVQSSHASQLPCIVIDTILGDPLNHFRGIRSECSGMRDFWSPYRIHAKLPKPQTRGALWTWIRS